MVQVYFVSQVGEPLIVGPFPAVRMEGGELLDNLGEPIAYYVYGSDTWRVYGDHTPFEFDSFVIEPAGGE